MDVDERAPTTEPVPQLTAAQVVADSQFELVPLSDLTERLAAAGYTAMPHVAAHSVRDRAHLQEIVARLKEARVNQILVVGGDAKEPGAFPDGLSLLRAIHETGHHFEEVEVPCYPEGHPAIADEALVQ